MLSGPEGPPVDVQYSLTAIPIQANAPLPYGPVPSENQLRWQQMEYYAFVHLSVNTYTDMAWGS